MSVYARRARYVPVEQGFNIKRPPLEPMAFEAEMRRAFAADAPTGFVPLDLSALLGVDYPATTPFMLTRYARVRQGETLACTLAASGEIWAVLRGRGRLERGAEALDWREGEMLALPGGAPSLWRAEEDAVLWVATDEPTLAFEGVRPELPERAPIELTHYRAEDVARELRALRERAVGPDTAGRAVFMASERTEALGTCLPSMTLTLNLVLPGEAQRPHRHNAAAIVLALREGRCASIIDGRRFPWTQHVTLLTPAGAPHEHANAPAPEGAGGEDGAALALIVQDGGLYYYGRTMGFSFV